VLLYTPFNTKGIVTNRKQNELGEIEKDLTATQEVNVNLQVLIEKAVNKQKESDVYATQAMRHIHSNLATVNINNPLVPYNIPTLFIGCL
jgi:hypothetical protein